MSNETKNTEMDEREGTDAASNNNVTDFTQIASCIGGNTPNPKERRRQSLRAKLEREEFDQDMQADENLMTTLRNLFKTTA